VASVTPRTIMHVDMDAFYAAVECVDDPVLAGQAVIVGGLGPRGVVATASYEARRFGVHSAMPMARARRLCPHACFIRPRMARYREVSAGVFRIFRDYTPLVEGLSLDEAFLDISASLRLFGGPLDVARLLKQRILDETGLSASVGIAHNKFLAKLASDARKPAGLVWVRPQEVRAFLDPMPVSRLWGIGKQTAPRLRALGVLTIGQLRTADPSALEPVLGNRTGHFLELARGEDDREVTAARADKSISREVTFDEDRSAREVLLAELQQQSESVARRLRAGHLLARTVTVKIRDNRFHTVTRSRSLRVGSDSTRTLYRMARALFDGWHESHRGTPVRLLGMGVSGLEDASASGYGQGEGGDAGRGPHIDHVVDDINRRFGDDKLTRAQTLRLRPPRGG
jgi:DNA polymerase-4